MRNLSQREIIAGSFLCGMLFMGVVFLALGAPTTTTNIQNEQCGRSIAVADALHEFIESQHGILFYPDGSRIIREEGTDPNAWRWGTR